MSGGRAEEIAVVGAGLTGLTIGHRLHASGAPVRVFEAQPRAGGLVGSRRREGFLLETGPNGYLDREPAMRALVEEVGLSGSVEPASPSARDRFIYAQGRMHALPRRPQDALRTGFVPWSAKLRIAAELCRFRRAEPEDEPLSSFVERHFGRFAARVLADAAQLGVFAGNVDALSAAAAFPTLHQLGLSHGSVLRGLVRRQREARREGATGPPALCTFRDGMETLPGRLGERLGEALELGARVTAIAPSPKGWSLRVEGPGGTRVHLASRLVLALPPSAAAALLMPFAPELSSELAAIRSAPVGVVQLAIPKATLPRLPEGFGVLVPSSEGLSLLGALFISSFFPFRAPDDQHLVTCLLGGMGRPLEVPPASLATCAQEELGRVLRARLDAQCLEQVFWPSAIPQYEVGHLRRRARVEALTQRHPGLALAGTAFGGVGVNDCIRNGSELARQILAARSQPGG